jgi:release factor glutamine methyltransferase
MPEQENQAWSIRDLMKFTIDHFQRRGFDEARLTIELLLAHALQCQRIELYTHFDKPLSAEELKTFRRLYERRLAHEPVQYIVGSTSFMGLQFAVDKRALIPRPETESLVEQVMMKCNEHAAGGEINILEIGTGSGNIAVSIAKLIKNSRVVSIDKSPDALAVANLNAGSHQVSEKITFLNASFLESLESLLPEQFDILVSNPPYVSIQEWQELDPEVREYEPKQAVSDQNDGYDFYRRIGATAKQLVRKGGWIIVEVGHGQSERVTEIFRSNGLTELAVVNDLQDIPRVVLAQCASE